MHCKHLYFIFVKVFNADPKVDLFIHALTFSSNEVKFFLDWGMWANFLSFDLTIGL